MVDVEVGDTVTADTRVSHLEAMKMENALLAGIDGVVTAVHVAVGANVAPGTLLVGGDSMAEPASASIVATVSARSSSPVPSGATPSTTPPSWSCRRLGELDADDDIGAVLIYGEGRSFCAGGDLDEFQRGLTSDAYEFHRGGAGWADLMLAIRRMRKPVVVAPHGHALAGGCGIVAAATWRSPPRARCSAPRRSRSGCSRSSSTRRSSPRSGRGRGERWR